MPCPSLAVAFKRVGPTPCLGSTVVRALVEESREAGLRTKLCHPSAMR